MGFALGFLKGVADGINTEAALEKQKELELSKTLAATKLTNDLALENSLKKKKKKSF